MPFGRSLLRSKTQDIEKMSPEIPILFHSSGLTSNQWRKLKTLWFPGRTLFRPSCRTDDGELMDRKKKQGWFFAQLAHSAGPTCLLYLTEEAPGNIKKWNIDIWSEFLPSWDSMNQNLLLLYGQYQSTLVDHMDVEKASDLENESGLETFLFHFHLPSSYLCFVCSPI
uniref:Ribosomal protein L10 n=1 Tax=Ceratozamia hildae TaxID=171009 RepID=A0A6M3X2I1_CERHI|nr:ribosomal protein L10 [Ceratozamia hildae]